MISAKPVEVPTAAQRIQKVMKQQNTPGRLSIDAIEEAYRQSTSQKRQTMLELAQNRTRHSS